MTVFQKVERGLKLKENRNGPFEKEMSVHKSRTVEMKKGKS